MPCSAKATATPTGSDGEFERAAVAREFGEAVDRRSQDFGGEHAGARSVLPPAASTSQICSCRIAFTVSTDA
jgi:hypothetical protein